MPMTKTAPAPVRDDALAILNRLGVPESALAAHGLPARSPITGEVVAHLRETTPDEAKAAIARARKAFLAWRTVPAPRRGELVRLLGEELRAAKDDARPARHARDRQDPVRRPRRSAGDDRHLRLRGRPVAPALRPDHRHRAAGPPHDGDVASARRRAASSRRSTSRSRCGRGTPRWPSSAAIRWSGSRRRRRRSRRSPSQALFERRAAERFGDAPEGLSEVLIGGRDGRRDARRRPARAARSRDRLDRHGPRGRPAARRALRPRDPRARRQQRRRSSRPSPTSTSRCARSPSPPSARRASAARRCAGCSCTRASTTRSFRS